MFQGVVCQKVGLMFTWAEFCLQCGMWTLLQVALAGIFTCLGASCSRVQGNGLEVGEASRGDFRISGVFKSSV